MSDSGRTRDDMSCQICSVHYGHGHANECVVGKLIRENHKLRAACGAANLAIKGLLPFAQIDLARNPLISRAAQELATAHQVQEQLQAALSQA